MTARGWWRRRTAKPRPEPAPKPARARWSLLDRQSDPALTDGRVLPRPDDVPRLWDSLPHR